MILRLQKFTDFLLAQVSEDILIFHDVFVERYVPFESFHRGFVDDRVRRLLPSRFLGEREHQRLCHNKTMGHIEVASHIVSFNDQSPQNMFRGIQHGTHNDARFRDD